ncbi:MAG TPA: aldo/keto reductase [Anaerolineales bacterium]|nr:aldo/keto reductase [Anaerolineales bacterium]
MEYRYLGRSGLQVSALSLGAWVTFGAQVDEDTAYECMRAAHDAGVNFFDNAEVYANGRAEIVMGNALKRAGWKRSDLVISTKIFWGGDGLNERGLSRKHILEGTHASLARLQLEYVDLIICHRPDTHTPIEETVRAMNFLIERGLAFYWGTSEWSAVQILEATMTARREHLIPPLMEQCEYNMFHRQRIEHEYTLLYQQLGLGTTIYSPLASGMLSGKYSQGIPEDGRASLEGYEWLREEYESEAGQSRVRKVEQLRPLAEELGCTLAQLALAWCLKNPDVSTVITGASRPEQVAENMQAIDVAEQLAPPVLERIEAILDNKPEPEEDSR